MDASRVCTVCGRLISDTLDGLCLECLMKAGFETGTIPDTRRSESAWALPSLNELSRLFPQFEILELINRGGMGAVYKARQITLNRFVAIKLLLPEKRRDPQFGERFEREAHALARLNHPNIITVHEFGRIQGHHFLTMEFVEGATLRQWMRNRTVSAADALAIISQMCQALQYAHDQGIVHRDIKPENVLIDSHGRVKITDFGIAKLRERAASSISLTGVRDVVGTLHYMAPEQLEKPRSVDHRADIYSAGVVLYEILTGELPIGRFQTPSQMRSIDARVDKIVLRALEKDPERRYQTAAHFRSDVESVANNGPSSGTTAKSRRGRTPVLIGGGIATLVLAISLVFHSSKPAWVAGIPLDGLVGFWPGEKNARDSMGNLDGEPANVSYVPGVFGKAFHFNGSNALVQIPDFPGLKPSNITVSAWVKLDAQSSSHAALPGMQTIVFKLNSRDPRQGNFVGYALSKDADRFLFTICSPSGEQVAAGSITAPQVGVWYHVVGTYSDFSQNLEIYINGEMEGTAHAGFPMDIGTRPLFLGSTGESVWDCKLQGAIDEVAIYDRVLGREKIKAFFEAGKRENPRLFQPVREAAQWGSIPSARPSESLVARWLASDQGKDSVGTNSASLRDVAFAERTPAFVFNGSDAQIRIPAGCNLNVGLGGGLSVAAWIKPTSSSHQAVLGWNRNTGVSTGTEPIGAHIEINPMTGDGILGGNIKDTSGIEHSICSAYDVIRLDAFQQVVMTYDRASGIAALYRNGMPVARVRIGSFMVETSFDFFIGNRPSGFFSDIYFQGEMDDIEIYNRALTVAEIRASYDSSKRRFSLQESSK